MVALTARFFGSNRLTFSLWSSDTLLANDAEQVDCQAARHGNGDGVHAKRGQLADEAEQIAMPLRRGRDGSCVMAISELFSP